MPALFYKTSFDKKIVVKKKQFDPFKQQALRNTATIMCSIHRSLSYKKKQGNNFYDHCLVLKTSTGQGFCTMITAELYVIGSHRLPCFLHFCYYYGFNV